MDRTGMFAMLEEAVRMGRWHRRFSSRFSDLADLLREASHLARSAGRAEIAADDVAAARRPTSGATASPRTAPTI